MSDSLQTLAREQELAPAGRLLVRLLETFQREGVAYCLLHGYERYPQEIGSDVDCIVPADITADRLAALLYRHGDVLQAEVVQWLEDRASFIVLRTSGQDGPDEFLQLHVAREYELRKRTLYTADEILASRRRWKQFWVPAPSVEFASYLARRIAKGRLDEDDQTRLAELYNDAPDACGREIARFWGSDSAGVIAAAAETGRWDEVAARSPHLRTELLRRTALRRPLRLAGNLFAAAVGRARKWLRRDRGLSVVLLGTDGAGKSSVAQAVADELAPAFSRYVRHTFPPGLRRRGPRGTNSAPHAAPPRSLLMSVLRALAYWLPYYSLGYDGTTGRLLRRNALVVHDRHLLDALVDPRRYRYGGPRWLLRLIWRLVRKPDLVILLDVPAEVAQARKQEVPFAETARQREAYRSLVRSLPNGHIVDAAQDLEQVAADVRDLLLRYLTSRTARRFGKEGRP